MPDFKNYYALIAFLFIFFFIQLLTEITKEGKRGRRRRPPAARRAARKVRRRAAKGRASPKRRPPAKGRAPAKGRPPAKGRAPAKGRTSSKSRPRFVKPKGRTPARKGATGLKAMRKASSKASSKSASKAARKATKGGRKAARKVTKGGRKAMRKAASKALGGPVGAQTSSSPFGGGASGQTIVINVGMPGGGGYGMMSGGGAFANMMSGGARAKAMPRKVNNKTRTWGKERYRTENLLTDEQRLKINNNPFIKFFNALGLLGLILLPLVYLWRKADIPWTSLLTAMVWSVGVWAIIQYAFKHNLSGRTNENNLYKVIIAFVITLIVISQDKNRAVEDAQMIATSIKGMFNQIK